MAKKVRSVKIVSSAEEMAERMEEYISEMVEESVRRRRSVWRVNNSVDISFQIVSLESSHSNSGARCNP